MISSLPGGRPPVAPRGSLPGGRPPVAARRRLLAVAVALLAVPALAGCEAGLNAPTLQFHQASGGAHADVNGITISNMYVLAAPSGSSLPAGSDAGVFLGLYNNGANGDTLTSVSLPSGGAKSATIDGGTVDVPATTGVNLTGPDPKVVLNGITQPLTGGQTIEMLLTFQQAGQVLLDVPVEPQSFYYSTNSQPATPTPTPVATSASTTQPGATATPKPTATKAKK